MLSGLEQLYFCAAWFEQDGGSAAMFYIGSTHRTVPLEELPAADVEAL